MCKRATNKYTDIGTSSIKLGLRPLVGKVPGITKWLAAPFTCAFFSLV